MANNNLRKDDIHDSFYELAMKRVQPEQEEEQYQDVCRKIKEMLQKNGHVDMWEQLYELESKRGSLLISTAYQQGICDGINLAKS
jgi:hypothetical protein